MEILKKLRKSKGLSTEQVANMVHVSKRTIENYESGKTSPDYETLKSFSRIFDVTIDYLLDEEKDVVFMTRYEYEKLIALKEIIVQIEKRESIKSKK